MIYGAVLLDAVSSLPHTAWEGVVYRHLFGANPPEKENQLGARWNPAEVPAIYCSLDKETAIAEGDFQIAVQPFKPKAERRRHAIRGKTDECSATNRLGSFREAWCNGIIISVNRTATL